MLSIMCIIFFFQRILLVNIFNTILVAEIILQNNWNFLNASEYNKCSRLKLDFVFNRYVSMNVSCKFICNDFLHGHISWYCSIYLPLSIGLWVSRGTIRAQCQAFIPKFEKKVFENGISHIMALCFVYNTEAIKIANFKVFLRNFFAKAL